MSGETFRCDTCDAVIEYDEARRIEPVSDLDTDVWQTFCCPECGSRLKTVFVGDEEA